MKSFMIYLSILMISNIYAQCDNYSQSQCNNDNNCEWVVDIDYGNCNNLGSSACDANPNCWGAYTNPGWYYGWYCAGGSYQIDNSYCEEIEILECFEMNEMECSNDNSCDWIENIEIEYCGGYNQGECLEQQGCWWYPGGWYLGEYCSGSYEVDNSYCVESEDFQCQDYQFQCSDGTCICLNSSCTNNADSVICDGVFDCLDGSDETDCSECSWINESACYNDANCNWLENIETGNCNWLSTSECVDNPQCWLDCTTNYDCFGCTGGWYEIDNGFCEETSFILGDLNGDDSVDILDVIILVNHILSPAAVVLDGADINNDGEVNILDVVDLVSIILGN